MVNILVDFQNLRMIYTWNCEKQLFQVMRRKNVDKDREGYVEYVKDASMMTGALSVYREIVKNKIEKNS